MKTYGVMAIVLGVPFFMFAAWVYPSARDEQRTQPAPSCYIGHLTSIQRRALPNGELALHFIGYMETKLPIVADLEATIPVWPTQEPDVLMCIRSSSGDRADLLLN